MTEQTYLRVELALQQLEDALDLFLDHERFASATTLAGAAEEIFGKELIRRGVQPVLKWKLEQIQVVHKLLHGKELPPKSFRDEENHIRNALRHFNEKEDPAITVDLRYAACWMLVRACENAKRLDIEIERFSDFDSWFYEHIVGI